MSLNNASQGKNRKWDIYTVGHFKSLLGAFCSSVRDYQDCMETTKWPHFCPVIMRFRQLQQGILCLWKPNNP